MALDSPAGPIDPELQENYEEIEKQFAVKGEQPQEQEMPQ